MIKTGNIINGYFPSTEHVVLALSLFTCLYRVGHLIIHFPLPYFHSMQTFPSYKLDQLSEERYELAPLEELSPDISSVSRLRPISDLRLNPRSKKDIRLREKDIAPPVSWFCCHSIVLCHENYDINSHSSSCLSITSL